VVRGGVAGVIFDAAGIRAIRLSDAEAPVNRKLAATARRWVVVVVVAVKTESKSIGGTATPPTAPGLLHPNGFGCANYSEIDILPRSMPVNYTYMHVALRTSDGLSRSVRRPRQRSAVPATSQPRNRTGPTPWRPRRRRASARAPVACAPDWRCDRGDGWIGGGKFRRLWTASFATLPRTG
jgi:hypothetical protein